ncbi:MAG: HAD family hydrolase [Janthinobacterium lividum]
MIRGVVFDMDGVLIEAKDWHYEALNRALGLFGFEISRYEHLTTYDGLPTRRKLDMLSIGSGLPRELHGFINDMKQIYTTELVHAHCRPQFVHEYALSNLKAAGLRLGVASNSVRSTVELMMHKASLAQYLDVMLSNEDVACAKPNPEIYVEAMRRLDLRPEECLVVEDNENGIAAARASGAHVMVVADVSDVTLDAIRRRIAACAVAGAA